MLTYNLSLIAIKRSILMKYGQTTQSTHHIVMMSLKCSRCPCVMRVSIQGDVVLLGVYNVRVKINKNLMILFLFLLSEDSIISKFLSLGVTAAISIAVGSVVIFVVCTVCIICCCCRCWRKR